MAVWIVAPALPQSGQGGRSDFTTEANLTGPSQYDLIPAGEPSVSAPLHLAIFREKVLTWTRWGVTLMTAISGTTTARPQLVSLSPSTTSCLDSATLPSLTWLSQGPTTVRTSARSSGPYLALPVQRKSSQPSAIGNPS